MKRRTNPILRVYFEIPENFYIKSIEFRFAQKKEETPSKKSITKIYQYNNNSEVKKIGDYFLIPFSAKDTEMFEPNKTFYMDPRIELVDDLTDSLAESHYPNSEIVGLKMNPTLFDTNPEEVIGDE